MPRKNIPIPATESRHYQYSNDDLRQATDQVIDGKLSSYEAAAFFNVPHGTVARHFAYYKRTGKWLQIG